MISLKFLYTRLQSRYLTWLFWIFIWLSLGLIFATLFDSLSKDALETEKLITNLPQTLRNSFNIDTGYLTKVEKFLSGQFLTVHTLVGTVFAMILGVGEIGGKIEDRTISNFLSKNISRAGFYALQSFSNFVFFLTSGAVVWGTIYILFKIFSKQPDISTQYFFSGFVVTASLFITISGIGQLLGIVFPKNTAQYGGIGYLVFSWFLNSLSTISGYPSWLKPLSPFYFINATKLRDEYAVDTSRMIVLFVLYTLSVIVGILIFRKKDLYL